MINIKYLKLNSNSSELHKQDFERLVLLYGAELDSHQNRNTPKDILTKWANSMVNIQRLNSILKDMFAFVKVLPITTIY